MRIIKAKDYDEVCERAAMYIAAQIQLKPEAVLGLATGSSPVGVYERLAEWYQKGRLDFSGIRSVNLDEYVGLDGENEQSYRYFMEKHLFSKVNILKENTYVPDGRAQDLKAGCERYDETVKKLGGIDLQLLGIGLNGHIGFNEPSDHFIEETHVTELAESTVQANSRFFASADEVPVQAVTMGIGNIMRARKVVLIASGKEKAQIIERAFAGNVTPEIPASVLKLHRDCTVIYG